jgi:hypothetical protein
MITIRSNIGIRAYGCGVLIWIGTHSKQKEGKTLTLRIRVASLTHPPCRIRGKHQKQEALHAAATAAFRPSSRRSGSPGADSGGQPRRILRRGATTGSVAHRLWEGTSEGTATRQSSIGVDRSEDYLRVLLRDHSTVERSLSGERMHRRGASRVVPPPQSSSASALRSSVDVGRWRKQMRLGFGWARVP